VSVSDGGSADLSACTLATSVSLTTSDGGSLSLASMAVPAAVLCQMLLPSPDFPTAFTLLKTTPAARLDVDYFEFLWEVSQVKCGDSRVVPMEQSPNCSLGKVFDPLNER
jgi:hypothetical protein